jgi:hypothetical protein
MELKFMDLSGPVTIPAESAEAVIKVGTSDIPARPAGQIEITQTLDTRQFQINGALPLEIKATAAGPVPELDRLIDADVHRTNHVKGVRALPQLRQKLAAQPEKEPGAGEHRDDGAGKRRALPTERQRKYGLVGGSDGAHQPLATLAHVAAQEGGG